MVYLLTVLHASAQVLGKRQKVVGDMCAQLAVKARQIAESDEWQVLSASEVSAARMVEDFLKAKLLPLAQKEPDHYNDNAPLGSAIQEAVNMTDILDGWASGLVGLAEKLGRTEKELVESAEPLALRDSGVRIEHCVCLGW
jgi:hypothetical protein